jgi:signal transduction histidine kinase
MIIAGSNRGQAHAASVANEPVAHPAATQAAGALFARARVKRSLAERRTAYRTADGALARERRRIAADVHDLIMQDLSLALASARALTDDPACACAQQANVVVSAGERALEGARQLLGELAEHDTRPIAQAVEASVRAAARHTPFAFHAAQVPATAELDEPTRHALVHIAREAVTNAVKHASASAVEVVLEHAGQWRLTVRDDGCGFDETPAGGGFGLASMRHSAHSLGGAVHVGRGGGGGTTVEAVLP